MSFSSGSFVVITDRSHGLFGKTVAVENVKLLDGFSGHTYGCRFDGVYFVLQQHQVEAA